MKASSTLTGHLNGTLRHGEPIPARLTLQTPASIRRIDPSLIRNLGMLLESVRMNDPEGYIRAQLKTLQAMGADPELIETILKSKIKVNLSIQNGAGNRDTALDLIRTLKELSLNGGQVSTYGLGEVISAGAYIWMTGDQRYTLHGTKFLWHTRGSAISGSVTEEDKQEDLQMMRPFFEGAAEPVRSQFLHAIDQDHKGCHEIRTTGAALIRAGLAERFE